MTAGVLASSWGSVVALKPTCRCAPLCASKAAWYGSRVCDISVRAMVPAAIDSSTVRKMTAAWIRLRRKSARALTMIAVIASLLAADANHVRGPALSGLEARVVNDPAVHDADHARGVARRELGVVGDEHDRLPCVVQLGEQGHDLLAARCIQRPGRLIGQ